MAVGKLLDTTNIVKIVNSGTLLKDTLTRFYEQCSRYDPPVLRKRLKKHLSSIRMDVDRLSDSENI